MNETPICGLFATSKSGTVRPCVRPRDHETKSAVSDLAPLHWDWLGWTIEPGRDDRPNKYVKRRGNGSNLNTYNVR